MPSLTSPIGRVWKTQPFDIARPAPQRSALQRGSWRELAGGDFGRWLSGQIELQFVEQQFEFGLGLCVAGEQ